MELDTKLRATESYSNLIPQASTNTRYDSVLDEIRVACVLG
jgi:hypothetical protein